MNRLAPRIGFALVLGWLASCPSLGRAQGSLNDALGELAKDVKAYLDTTGKNKVTVGQFVGRGDIARRSSASPLLQESMTKMLKDQKVDVVEMKGDYELDGSYTEAEDVATQRQFVTFSVELRDKLGNARKFSSTGSESPDKAEPKAKADKYLVKNEADLSKILGVPSYVPPTKNEQERIQEIKKQVDEPHCEIKDAKIFAGKGAPYAIEILAAPAGQGAAVGAKGNYALRMPIEKGGLAYATVARNEAYCIRLYNYADYDVAVDLRIDGLSMYHFCEQRDASGGPYYRYVIVPKNKFVTIYGWFVGLNASDEFVVTDYAKSAAGKLGSPAFVGTVTANYHAAWAKVGGTPPPDEPQNPNRVTMSAGATGRGGRFDGNFQAVEYVTGMFRGSVSVRYSK